MQLIDDGSFVEDVWIDRSCSGALTPEDIDRDGDLDIIVSQTLAASLDIPSLVPTPRGRLGVRIDNDIDLECIDGSLAHLSLIAVAFPSSADGRGFSLARQLRKRGFRGELRASGPLIADQYAFARACGFDTVEIPDAVAARQPEAQWLHAQNEICGAYQPGYAARASVLEARHGDRGSGETGGLEVPSVEQAPPRTLQATAPSVPMWWAHW